MLETFRWRPPMFLYRFQAPNTLYQMRPTRGPKSIPTASYGTFYFRKIFEKLKSALSAQIKSKWLENRCSCYIKIRRIFAFQPFFKWGPGKKIDQVEPLFGFPNSTEHTWWLVEKSGRKFFFESCTFSGPKGAEKREFFGRNGFPLWEPTFFEKVRFLDFLKFF